MSIQRNKVPEPQWDKWDYAERIKHDLFSNERWGKTVEWDIILKQVEKTRQASQMIDIKLYPSALFFAAIDLLKANLYVLDDMFYFLTGVRMTETRTGSEKMMNVLGFWNMDSYNMLKQIYDGLIQARIPLIECLKQEPIKDITLKVVEKQPLSKYLMGTVTVPK